MHRVGEEENSEETRRNPPVLQGLAWGMGRKSKMHLLITNQNRRGAIIYRIQIV